MEIDIDKPRALRFVPLVYALLVVLFATLIGMLLWSNHASMEMIEYSTPLVDAAMEIKLEVTEGHLWFEESVGGDMSQSLEKDVWPHFDKAEWYIMAMLEGGQNKEGTYQPLRDPVLRREVQELLLKMHQFRQRSRERAEKHERAGTETDKLYDEAFKAFIVQAENVETSIQQQIKDRRRQYHRMSVSVLAVVVILTIVIAAVLFVYQKAQGQHLSLLEQAMNLAKDSGELLHATMYSMGDAVITTDAQGLIQRMNPVAETLTGWTEEEAKGERLPVVFKIVNALTREPAENPFEKVMRTGEIVGLANHTALIAKDGKEYQIADSGAPIRNRHDEVTGVVLVFHDVTESYRKDEVIRQNEERFRSLLTNMSEGLCLHELVTDESGMPVDYRIESVNPAYETILGMKKEDVIGKLGSDVYRMKPPPFIEQFARTAITGKSELMQQYFEPMDKHFRISVFCPGKHKFATIFSDVTEQVKMTEALRNSEENLQITLDSMGDGVIATDAAGNVTRMNRVAEVMTGWPEAEASGRGLPEVFDIINADTREKADNPVAKVLASGRIEGLANHTVLLNRDGTERQIADSAAPITGSDGTIVGVVLIFRDVTEHHQMEEQLRQSQKMEAIGQLAGGIAHDFNNMLGGILGAAEVLGLSMPKEDPKRRFLDVISDAADHASELTSKLLSFSRKGKLLSTPFDIHTCVKDALTLLQHTRDRRVQVETKLHASVSTIIGDPSEVQNAILNLCINACDAMPSGGKLTITSEITELSEAYCDASGFNIDPGPHVELVISDTGTGMSDDVVNRIFEPFYTTKGVGQGTGLGLSAVYGTVENHRGAVTVYSSIGEGTSFHLFLPIDPDAKVEKLSEEPIEKLGPGCVLVVDDESVIRVMANGLLEDLGYEVLMARDGEEGVELFQQNRSRIDAVLLDLVMPRMNGSDCLKHLKQIDPNVKVIISSGFARDASVERLLHAGACAFIKKPYRRLELAKALAQTQKS